MSRGIGEFDPIQESIPDWLGFIIGMLTQLGDIWFLTLLLALLYWTHVELQDDIVLVGGMLVAGIGFYRALKFAFELPRPDEPLMNPEILPWILRPLYELTAFSHSYGFPSGHATVSTIVYFGLALVLPYGSRRLRFLSAGVLVGFVGFTRIALGLHYLVDIVAGVILGALILFVAFRLLRQVKTDQHTALLFVALGLNALYLVVSEFDFEAWIMIGAAVGFLGGWQLIILSRDIVAADRPSGAIRPLLVRGSLAVVVLGPLVYLLFEYPLLSDNPVRLAGITGAVVTVGVIIPIARHSKTVNEILEVFSFWGAKVKQFIGNTIR